MKKTMRLRPTLFAAALAPLLLLLPGEALAQGVVTLEFATGQKKVLGQKGCQNGDSISVTYSVTATGDSPKLSIYLTKQSSCTPEPPTDAYSVRGKQSIAVTETQTVKIPGTQLSSDCADDVEVSALLCAVLWTRDLYDGDEDDTGHAQLELTYDAKAPEPPVLAAPKAGDGTIYLAWTGSGGNSWKAYYRESGERAEGGADPCTVEAPPALFPAPETEPAAPTEDVDLAGWKSESISDPDGRKMVLDSLKNGQRYEIMMVATDEAGNVSRQGNHVYARPWPVQDFYRRYRCAGGSDEGEFGCSHAPGSAGGGALLGAGMALAALLLLARSRRRSPSRLGGRGALLGALLWAAGAVALPSSAAAQDSEGWFQEPDRTLEPESEPSKGRAGESERDWVFEFDFMRYRPQLGKEQGVQGDPYKLVFGSEDMYLFTGTLEHHLFTGIIGAWSLGLGAGFGTVSEKALQPWDGKPSPDETALRMVPMKLQLAWRFDYLAREVGIPLVPFAKGGLVYALWWATRGDGKLSKHEGGEAFGGRAGYTYSGGLALALNAIDPVLGREFDLDFGVNAVYFSVEYMRMVLDGFGKEGIVLSDDAWVFGLSFEF